MNSLKPMRIMLLVCMLIHFVCGFTSVSLAEEGDANRPPVRTVRMAAIYDAMAGVNTEDARMALEMLMRNIMTSRDNPFAIQLDFIKSINEAPEKIADERYDFLIVTGLDYLDLRVWIELVPKLVLSKIESPVEPLVLVTRRNETLDTLKQKDSRAVILEMGRAGDMDKLWLDTLLMEETGRPSELFFTEIRRSTKTSRSVLPVFFGQAEACVVPNSALAVMQELNPQIGSQLQVLRRSEDLVTLLLCAVPWTKKEDVEAVVNEAANAIHDPKAKQALTIVQMNGFYRYQQEHMQGTIALFERYKHLMGKQNLSENRN